VKRGLKFLSLLTKNDLLVLARSFDKDAEYSSQKMGNEIVERVVSEGAKLISTSKKSGPKRKCSTNQTDEDLRRLVETVRATVGFSEGLSRFDVLRSLWSLVADTEQCFTDHLLVSRDEYVRLRRYCSSLKEAGHWQDAELISCFEWMFQADISELNPSPSFEELALDSESRSQKVRSFKDEAELYSWLAISLQMIAPAPDSNQDSYKDFDVTRGEILRTGLARVNHIKQLLGLVQFAIDGQLIAEMHSHVSGAYERDLENKAAYEKMHNLLHHAMHRQGIHPLLRLSLENLNMNPKQFEEGEVYPGGYFGGKLAKKDSKGRKSKKASGDSE
jgi:hypothetical protein